MRQINTPSDLDSPTYIKDQWIWSPLDPVQFPNHEVWYLKFEIPESDYFFWLHINFDCSTDKKHKQIDFFAVLTQANNKYTLSKTWANQQPKIENSTLSVMDLPPHNKNQSHKHSNITWNLETLSGQINEGAKNINFEIKVKNATKTASSLLVPKSLAKLGIVKNKVSTPHQSALFEGHIQLNGQSKTFTQAIGMYGHLYGKKNGFDWTWVHCSDLTLYKDLTYTQKVQIEPNLKDPHWLEILSARAQLLFNLKSPKLTSSAHNLVPYSQLEQGFIKTLCQKSNYKVDLNYVRARFELATKYSKITVLVQALRETFVGVQYRDTNQTKLYCYNTPLAQIEGTITDKKTKQTYYFKSQFCTLEIVQRVPWKGHSLCILF